MQKCGLMLPRGCYAAEGRGCYGTRLGVIQAKVCHQAAKGVICCQRRCYCAEGRGCNAVKGVSLRCHGGVIMQGSNAAKGILSSY